MTTCHDFEDDLLGLTRVLHLLETRIHPFAVYLFGSAARGTLRDDSDIDLAFLSDATLTAYEQYLLAQEAAELLNREVDLVSLQTDAGVTSPYSPSPCIPLALSCTYARAVDNPWLSVRRHSHCLSLVKFGILKCGQLTDPIDEG